MSGALLLLLLYAFVACTGAASPFCLYEVAFRSVSILVSEMACGSFFSPVKIWILVFLIRGTYAALCEVLPLLS